MRHISLTRIFKGPLPVAILLILLLVSLHLMSSAVQNTAELNRLFVPLLVFTVIGISVLIILVIINLTGLIHSYRQDVAGSKLTVRLLLIFITLSLIPVFVVYSYSQQFMLKGIDSWFNVEIDQAMEDALNLSRASLDEHKRNRYKQTSKILVELEAISVDALTLDLNELRHQYGATELSLMNYQGKVITSSHVDPTILFPSRPDLSIIRQVREGQNFIGLTQNKHNGQLQIRIVINDQLSSSLLQALYPTSSAISLYTEKVETAYNLYKELSYLRDSLKNTYTMTLALVLIFSLLSAIWAALFTSRKLVAPIADIAQGTQAITEGDYELQLPTPSYKDELGFLVSSFNTMTKRISQSHQLAAHSQQALSDQHHYLETVLSRLSSGVMTFDQHHHLKTANLSAGNILHIEHKSFIGKNLDSMAQTAPHLQQLINTISLPLSLREEEWQGEVTLLGSDRKQTLLCRIIPLTTTQVNEGGHILVFDDISQLINAQRNAAWGEVARRLAHEIKNPLTPIQLSAERLRHKFLHHLPEKEAGMLDRSTQTIINQVEAMKTMVNSFSDYARPTKIAPQAVEIDHFLREIMELYKPHHPILDLNANHTSLNLDPVKMRQVMHNLIKNAIEATEHGPQAEIRLSSQLQLINNRKWLEICVKDNGIGIKPEQQAQMFDPYITSKVKGTGLGLAIVKRIIEEHDGHIYAKNNLSGGASLIIQLPISTGEIT